LQCRGIHNIEQIDYFVVKDREIRCVKVFGQC
jgi:hypothetical protein